PSATIGRANGPGNMIAGFSRGQGVRSGSIRAPRVGWAAGRRCRRGGWLLSGGKAWRDGGRPSGSGGAVRGAGCPGRTRPATPPRARFRRGLGWWRISTLPVCLSREARQPCPVLGCGRGCRVAGGLRAGAGEGAAPARRSGGERVGGLAGVPGEEEVDAVLPGGAAAPLGGQLVDEEQAPAVFGERVPGGGHVREGLPQARGAGAH